MTMKKRTVDWVLWIHHFRPVNFKVIRLNVSTEYEKSVSRSLTLDYFGLIFLLTLANIWT